MKEKSYLAKLIQNTRKQRGYTQSELAMYAGVTESAIRKIEGDLLHPKYSVLYNICIILDIDFYSLLNHLDNQYLCEEMRSVINAIHSSELLLCEDYRYNPNATTISLTKIDGWDNTTGLPDGGEDFDVDVKQLAKLSIQIKHQQHIEYQKKILEAVEQIYKKKKPD